MNSSPTSATIEISVVVPFYNEEKHVLELSQRLLDTLNEMQREFELIFVDDGSGDATWERMIQARDLDSRIKLLKFTGNFGQTPALAAGIHHACGEIIIPMDGDLQHKPEDIPRFVAKLEEGYDIVSGWRQKRMDNALTRKLPSRIANWLMCKMSGVKIHDFGTTFKAYRADIIKDLVLYGDFHRFIPALATARGARITEEPIENILRPGGGSNYNITRTFTVFFDLFRISFLLHFIAQPLKLFGSIGALFGLGGAGIAFWLVCMKYLAGAPLTEYRFPLFIASLFAIVVGIQFFTFGLLAEMNTRIYHEMRPRSIYSVREKIGEFHSTNRAAQS